MTKHIPRIWLEYRSISDFRVSCFGQWMMSLDVDRELNHTFLVSDTLQSYTSLWLSYSAIVNWFADRLVQICRTILYINMVGSKHVLTNIYPVNVWNMRRNFNIHFTFGNAYSNCQLKIMQSSYKHLKYFLIPTIRPHRSRHHPPFQPLAMMRHRTWRGDM